MTKPNSHDPELDSLLAASDVTLLPDRVHMVRTSILVAAHAMGKRTLADLFAAMFGLPPAVLVATCLLGLFLGASLPVMGLDTNNSAAFLDYHPQGFLTGDYG